LLIYGGSANRISTALQVETEIADKLLDNYFSMFPELKHYIDTVSTKAKYQKWVECPITNRRYFVGESNAKGLNDDNTIQRKACNTLIQGISAIMTKKAAFYVDELFTELNNKYSSDIKEGKHGRIIALVHDEIVSYIPGQGKIIDLIYKETKNQWVPKYEWKPLSLEYAKAQEEGMKRAMDELLHPLIPGFPSKASCELGSSWAAK
jgi:DNA polymerase I-like protein with 3'-5' exonuclease and polymerase domains